MRKTNWAVSPTLGPASIMNCDGCFVIVADSVEKMQA
jgi:hypothetical protein